MRKFKFVGDPHGYNNVPIFGNTYNENESFTILNTRTIVEWLEFYPEDWEEVFSPWISVNDRLPSKQDFYLVIAPKSFPKNCTMLIAEFYEDNNTFYSESGDNSLEDVTYWMPLPEPPK